MVIVDSILQSSWIFIFIYHDSFVLIGVNVPNLFRPLLGERPWISCHDLEFSCLVPDHVLVPSLFVLKDTQFSYYEYSLLVSVSLL